MLVSAGRTAVASLPLVVWCGLAVALWPTAPTLWMDAAWLGATIAGAVGLFLAASAMLGAPERAALLRMLR